MVFWITDDRSISISPPGSQVIDELWAESRPRRIVEIVCGERAVDVLSVVGPEDVEVTALLAEDLLAYFGLDGLPRLGWLLSRYGKSIERDLSYFHNTDLLDLWRGLVSPAKVLAYIDCLPSWSAFMEASAQDDEVAEMYAAQEHGPSLGPRVIEWTPERAELVKVYEAIQGLTALVHNALGGKSPLPKPEPRPQTAADRLAARVEDASYEYLLERIAEAQAGEG